MNDVVELGNSTVPDFGSCESSFSLDLRRKVTEQNNGGLIGSEEQRSDEKIRRRKGRRITVCERELSDGCY